ncbi:MAG TPA: PDZ domain-containing protein [Anaerolineales bacterium]|nr:PDZ domain-containing protein [Anaerolineae bacterium]HIQ02485.1 PDZ domain-containing protein [Anaerolineales bacterium]
MSSYNVTDKRARIYAVLLLTLVFLLSLAGGVLAHRLLERRQAAARNRPLAVFWEAWDILEEGFYGELPSARRRTYGAIRGALALLDDPYTIFLEPQPGEVERDRLAGAYGGIGVDLWRDAEGRVILSPFPDSPAERAGVQPGDILLAVDGESVATDTTDKVRVRLRGEVSTTVTLTLSRPPTPPFDLEVIRTRIQMPSVTYRVLDQDPTIGYLHITGFTERTPTEAAEAVDALLSAEVSRLVLDLRDNGGGLIQPAVEVSDLFLDGGVVLYELHRGEEERTFRAHAGGAASDLPLVVLTNGSTASAAEMVAGAIQARERGILIGEPTFGKGSVQLIYTLSDGSSLHVTAAIWLLPNRQPIHTDGLTPDIPAHPTDDLQDAPLDRAVLYLQTGE